MDLFSRCFAGAERPDPADTIGIYTYARFYTIEQLIDVRRLKGLSA
jgi:hypothetical protein